MNTDQETAPPGATNRTKDAPEGLQVEANEVVVGFTTNYEA